MSWTLPPFVTYTGPLSTQNLGEALEGEISKIFDHLPQHQTVLKNIDGCQTCTKIINYMLAACWTPLTVKKDSTGLKGPLDLYKHVSNLQEESFIYNFWKQYFLVKKGLTIIFDPKEHPELYPSKEKVPLNNPNKVTFLK